MQLPRTIPTYYVKKLTSYYQTPPDEVQFY